MSVPTATEPLAQPTSGRRPHLESGTAPMFINGQWADSANGASRPVFDPSTGMQIAAVAEATPDDARTAVRAARNAFDSGTWRNTNPRERGRVLVKAAEVMRERAEELARLESLDTGKPLLFTRTVDVPTATDMIEYYGNLASGIEGSVRSTSIPAFAYTLTEPIGVVAAITPFNFPLILSATKIGPALAAGNTVVHKPAEETPLTARLIAEILSDAGLPDGVFNVVTGGAEAGDALVRDPDVDKIAFTGSTNVGRGIATVAAQTLKHVTVELGGKGANLIFADADLEAAVNTAINGFTFNTGQFCMAGSRLLVERPVYEDVIAALGQAIPHIPIGDPFDDGTIVGPMAGPRHRDKVSGYLAQARDNEGLRILDGGAIPNSGGYFVSPTVIADVEQNSPFVQEEIFGPVLTVQAFDTEDEAIKLANGTQFGLAAGMQTSNVTRAHRVAARLNAGLIWVNTWGMLDVAVPFGGVKDSGYGRECGPEALAEYQQTKSVLISSL